MEAKGEGKPLILGKSILVPSVQELTKNGDLKEIPERYIQSEQQATILKTNGCANDSLKVPVINMETLINGDEAELHKLHLACKEWGFFQVIEHGISSSLMERLKQETKEFFNLPMEEKQKYWQSPTDLEGFGQAFVVSEEQKLNWGDMFYATTYPRHLRRPNLLPVLPLPYRDTLENYTTEVRKLARKLLDVMAKALNLDSDGNVFGEGHQSIRLNYYPPCPEPEKVIGLKSHSDSPVLITILLQVSDIQGLQVMKDSKWVPIKPLPQAFVVNIGDVLEMMTNGIYRSVLHRAVVDANNSRLSVATFHSPATDHEIGPFPKLITATAPAKFRRLNMRDYWQGFLAHPFDGHRYIDSSGVRVNDL